MHVALLMNPTVVYDFDKERFRVQLSAASLVVAVRVYHVISCRLCGMPQCCPCGHSHRLNNCTYDKFWVTGDNVISILPSWLCGRGAVPTVFVTNESTRTFVEQIPASAFQQAMEQSRKQVMDHVMGALARWLAQDVARLTRTYVLGSSADAAAGSMLARTFSLAQNWPVAKLQMMDRWV